MDNQQIIIDDNNNDNGNNNIINNGNNEDNNNVEINQNVANNGNGNRNNSNTRSNQQIGNRNNSNKKEENPVNNNGQNVIENKPEDKKQPSQSNINKRSDDKSAQNASNIKDGVKKKIITDPNVKVFHNNLNSFNGMYGLNIDADKFAESVIEAYELLKKEKVVTLKTEKGIISYWEGMDKLNDLFKDTLKQAFDIEKKTAYEEHRFPEYTEIIVSANDLLRASMFAFTDLYRNPESAKHLEKTAFGGLDAKQMAELTKGKSLWSMNQKSDKAWEIQSAAAKEVAKNWLEKEEKPYEKMISELQALVKAKKGDYLDRKEMMIKLTAAEWLLVTNDKMMIEDPADPYGKIPKWGNRYWEALTKAREALGIEKHTSMRDIIQAEYAQCARAINSPVYYEAHIKEHIMEPDARAVYDSMESHMTMFETQSKAIELNEAEAEKKINNIDLKDDENKKKIYVEQEDEYKRTDKMSRVFSNVVKDDPSLKLDKTASNQK